MMPIDIPLPTTTSAQLLWSQAVLIWVAGSYTLHSGPYGREEYDALAASGMEALRHWRRWSWAKAVVATAVTVALPGALPGRLFARVMLGLVIGAAILLLVELRLHLLKRPVSSMLTGLDVGMSVCVASATGIVIAGTDLSIGTPVVRLPASADTMMSVTLILAAAIFLVGGATQVVRNVLDLIGTKPRGSPGQDDEETDREEYNRGRIIGNLERLLLFSLSLTGSYEAMVLVIAAKGLVRWPSLEQKPEFAEYVLVGSLVSLLLALVVAMATAAILGIPIG